MSVKTPGIYIEGVGGVRLEGVILVTEDGRELQREQSDSLA